MPEGESILIPFLLTLFAGLATGIGSVIALVAQRTNKKLLAFSLGLSAGVMVYVSFMEILSQSNLLLTTTYGARLGQTVAVLCFFVGILLIGLIDRLVPSAENPHEAHMVEELNATRKKEKRLKHVGIVTALAIGIHNFPEGMATFMASVEDSTLGLAIAVAVAIHNIPEGIAVSVPIYYSTGSRKKAFVLSFLSGLAEPIGALIAYFILLPFLSPVVLGCVFGVVAGIMIYISFDELLPAAHEYGEHHIAISGVVIGMAVMAVSLILFA